MYMRIEKSDHCLWRVLDLPLYYLNIENFHHLDYPNQSKMLLNDTQSSKEIFIAKFIFIHVISEILQFFFHYYMYKNIFSSLFLLLFLPYSGSVKLFSPWNQFCDSLNNAHFQQAYIQVFPQISDRYVGVCG